MPVKEKFSPGQRVKIKPATWQENCNMFTTNLDLFADWMTRRGVIDRMAAVPGYWWVKIDDVPMPTLRHESEIERDYLL